MIYRPTGFSRGQLRLRMLVEEPTSTVGSTGTGEPTVTWSTLYSAEPCRLEVVSANETAKGKQVEAGVNAVATVNWRSSWSTRLRCTVDGVTYHVVGVKPVDGGRRYTELMLKAVV